MDSNVTCIVNLVFAGIIAVLSIVGYVFTIKKTGQHWPLWIVLAVGWIILAIPYAVFLADYNMSVAAMAALWLSSYVLIMVSLVLLFLKLMQMMKNREKKKETPQ
jgi:RsiW-degrading membrane proteinase PrsW (M82 family)